MIDAKEKIYQTCITNREKILVSGVMNVECFGEEYLTLNTTQGQLTIEGENLKIESLTKENGEILITGKICGLFYREERSEKGFLRKIFK